MKKLFSGFDSLSALAELSAKADTIKNFLTERNRKVPIILAKSFYRRWDKQFGTNGTSLFIFEFAFRQTSCIVCERLKAHANFRHGCRGYYNNDVLGLPKTRKIKNVQGRTFLIETA